MGRGREEVQIFSTAFLDLLFCGLAAVALLWVLVEPASEVPDPVPFSFLRITQRGLWHLDSIAIESVDGAGPVLSYTKGSDRVLSEAFRQDAEANYGLLATVEEGTEDGFAGRIVMGADQETKRCVITVSFAPCFVSDETHPINVVAENNKFKILDNILYTEENALRTAWSSIKVNDAAAASRLESLRRIAVTGSPLTLRFDVNEGRMRYNRPVAAADPYGRPPGP